MLTKSAIPTGVFLILVILLAVSSPGAIAYQPALEWNWTYGSSYGDGAWSVQQTSDGGYIVAGYTCEAGSVSDLWLLKVGPAGQETWKRTFGGTDEDIGYYVRQAKDGGYIVTGSTKSYGVGNERLWLLKVRPDGTKEWDKTFGGFVSSSGDGGWSVDNTDDGGYIVTGYTRSFGAGGKDLWLIKTDASGRRLWERTFGGLKDDTGYSVQQANDGGYIVAGQTESYSTAGDDLWLLKTDQDGREEWNRTFSGAQDEVGFQVVKTIDGGYAIVGRTDSGQEGLERALLLKVDSLGKKQFERSFGLTGLIVGTSVDQTMDGGYIIAGRTESADFGKDMWIVRTDSAGKRLWEMSLGGYDDEIATSVGQTRDGGYIVAGITQSFGYGSEDAWLVRIGQDQISSVTRDFDDQVLVPNDMAAGTLMPGKAETSKDKDNSSAVSDAKSNTDAKDNANTGNREDNIDKMDQPSASDKLVTTKKPKSNILESNINQVLRKKMQSQHAL